MSTTIMSACWPLQHMSVTQKAVLISLADNANDQGVCWPSIPTIAARCCLSVRAVQNAIKWLESAGIVSANRNNGRHTSYTLTPAGYAPPQDMHPRTRCTPAPDAPANAVHPTPAPDAPHPGTPCTPPPHDVPSNRKEPSREPSLNRQPARRASRVALHVEIEAMELPEWLLHDDWAMWCEHREAKAKDAPWTRGAATVSIRRLAKLRGLGHDARAVIEEAVLRGWTGLFPVKDAQQSAASAASGAPEWWKTESGVVERGRQLGIERKPQQYFEQFKAKVCKTAGPGEWMEDMLRTVSRESEERGEALYAYFNDVQRDKVAQTEAA